MIDGWIHSEYLDEKHRSDLQWKFLEARPFSHISAKGFLKEEKAIELAAALKTERFIEKNADLFQFKQTNDLSGTSNESLKQFYAFLASEEFSEFIRQLTGVPVQAGGVDVFGSLYESTDYLLCHDDQLEDRKIAYLFYLGDDFNMSDGGNFCLIDNVSGTPNEIVKKIPPSFNGFVAFAVSDKSFHSVEEVIHQEKKRYAIGGWLK